MSQPLDELYFKWLYSQIGSTRVKDPKRTYWKLAKLLFTKEFIWFVPNDFNRIQDGKDLRYEFIFDKKIAHVDSEWMGLGCSMLELLVGLSRRLSFQADGDPRDWFWLMARNLNLHQYNDSVYVPVDKINDILDTVIWRTYDRNGHGGIFPLNNSIKDQTKVEIWYQLGSYMIENY